MSSSKIITVFGSSRVCASSPAYGTALELGKKLAQKGYSVCSGGHKGIMEAVSKGAREAGGNTIGIISHEFGKKANEWISDVRTEQAWKDRLFSLILTGDAYIYFDGGTGTWTELFVTWEMMSKRLLPMKPMVLLGPDVKETVKLFKGREGFLFHTSLYSASGEDEAVRFIEEGLKAHADRK